MSYKLNRFNIGDSPVKRACFLAVLAALFIVLDLLSIRISNNIKITFGGLPILVAAMCFSPVEGVLVGLVGSFLAQLLSFGITATTPLWVLPAGVRGLAMGLLYIAFRRSEKIVPISVCVLISSLIVTAFNTLAIYVDSKVYGYYSLTVVFGATAFRLISSVLTSACYVALLIPINKALKKIL